MAVLSIKEPLFVQTPASTGSDTSPTETAQTALQLLNSDAAREVLGQAERINQNYHDREIRRDSAVREAADYFEPVLQLIPPSHPAHVMLKAGIARARDWDYPMAKFNVLAKSVKEAARLLEMQPIS